MGEPIRTPPRTSVRGNPGQAPTSSSLNEGVTTSATAAEPEEQADQAAADLDALSIVHRRSAPRRRRSPARHRPQLSPRQVAERFVEGEAEGEAQRSLLGAMEPLERRAFVTELAGKLSDVAVGHIQGAVETFNGVRANFNARRVERGEAALPPVELNSESMRAMLQAGIEEGLEAGLRLVLETALHALFGEPSRLPQADDAASSLGSLPELEELDTVFHLRWSQPF
ncbi:MAG: hypothetical protein AB8H86_15820 [Polyangiales bacterium]